MNIKVRLNSHHETLCSLADDFFSESENEDCILVFEPHSEIAGEEPEKHWIDKRAELALAFLNWDGPLPADVASFAVQYVGRKIVVSNNPLDES